MNKVKIIAIAVLFVFSLGNIVGVNRLYATVPQMFNNNMYKTTYEFEINSKDDIDSINNVAESISQHYYDYHLIFISMNENEIDNFINRFNYRLSISGITFAKCSIIKLPLSLHKLDNLNRLELNSCHQIESMNQIRFSIPLFDITFWECNLECLPVGLEDWKSMLNLKIIIDSNYNYFDAESSLSKFKKRNNIMSLILYDKNMNAIPISLKDLTALRYLTLISNEEAIPLKLDDLTNLLFFCTNIEVDSIFENTKLQDDLWISRYQELDNKWSDMIQLFNIRAGHPNIPFKYEGLKLGKHSLKMRREIDSIFSERSSEYVPKSSANFIFNVENKEFIISSEFDSNSIEIQCDNLNDNDNAIVKIIDYYTGEIVAKEKITKSVERIISLDDHLLNYFILSISVNDKESSTIIFFDEFYKRKKP